MKESIASLGPILRAALGYSQRGWSLLPLCPWDHAGVSAAHEAICTRPGRTPLWPWHAYQERRPRDAELRLYWNRTPRANLGLVLGPVSGLVAVELAGPAAAEPISRLHGGPLPPTLTICTPDGTHCLLFALPPRSPSLAGGCWLLADGVQAFAAGTSIVLPPSRASGGRAWSWQPGAGPGQQVAAVAPPWLLRLLRAGPGGRRALIVHQAREIENRNLALSLPLQIRRRRLPIFRPSRGPGVLGRWLWMLPSPLSLRRGAQACCVSADYASVAAPPAAVATIADPATRSSSKAMASSPSLQATLSPKNAEPGSSACALVPNSASQSSKTSTSI